ncbi:MAG: RNA polymerase subunit sigma [Cellulomonas sp. 73-92]|nr:MAG: RNA polymerase subunit sigma [Cellulomonas sp. 73-92]
MMSDEVTDPVETGIQDEDQGLAHQAAHAVAAYRSGDREPLARLVRSVTPLLWRTVRAQGAGHEQAQDLVQNVWLTLVRDIETIRDPDATLQWLLVTARRAAWRAVRRSRDEMVRTEQDEQVTEWLAAPSDEAPDAAVARDERDRALWRHVGALSERCRQLLSLVAMVDRPDYSVVSRTLGMPVGSIGPTRGRCLAKLRLALAADPSWSAR